MEKGYESAAWLQKLRTTKTIVGLDMDDTIATDRDDPSDEQLEFRRLIRELLRSKGVVEVAQSMRTWELMLSSKAYNASPQIQQVRKVPKYAVVGTPQGLRQQYGTIEGFRRFDYCLDWDAILVPGNGIALRVGNEYIVDWEWDHILNHGYGLGTFSPRPWRKSVRDFITGLYPKIEMFFAPMESEDNYHQGYCDVLTLQYRIQLDFLGADGFDQKEEFKRLLAAARDTSQIARRIKTIDESNPAKDKYTLYLVPWRGRKESLLNRYIKKASEASGSPTEQLTLVLAGDTLTDLRAGLYGGGDAHVSFFLPCNSRLTPYLAELLTAKKPPALWAQSFAGESLTRLCKYLIPTNKKGEYLFTVPTRHKRPNRFIFGLEAHPGKVGAEGVLAFLEDELA